MIRNRYAIERDGQRLGKTVRAYTKGEARALFKRIAFIPRRQRLPVCYKVVQVPV